MKTVGIRALKQNASAVIRDVASGEEVTVTDRGRPVARIVPITSGTSRLEMMIASGEARPPRSTAPLGSPLPNDPGSSPLSDVLREMRDTERF